MTAAGPLFHVVMLLIFGWTLDTSWRSESPSSALAPLFVFNLANLILLVRSLNLWDRSGFVTDGARLWGYLMRRTSPENQTLVMAATACAGAALHLQSGSWQQAKQITELALTQAPDHWGLRLLHATSVGESGNPGQAVQALREMLRTPPTEAGGDATAQNNPAWYLMVSGQEVDGKEVLLLAEEASRYLPWDLGCKSTLGAAQAIYGEPQGALALLDENLFLTRLSSERVLVAAARAIALHRTGQKQEVLACLLRAEQLASAHPMVQRARMLLAQEGG
jgi:Tfp pilus assembly protein PilF